MLVSLTSALNFPYSEALKLTPKEAFSFVVRYNELNSIDDEKCATVTDKVDASYIGIGVLDF